ncbi:protein kinase domain-containing protein [Gemmata sp.]|uniref:serine/threonine-protein kinase n=1 Tax=Gemmata sp. TaxID=1914242 RepID=UPI003F707ED8
MSRPTVTFSRLPPDPEAEAAAPTVGWTIAGPSSAPDIGGDSDSAASTVLSFGEYVVVSEIGEGGMGRVYKAIDRNLGRHVAVKVLRNTDPFESSRFRGEAEMIALLSHPNIVQIFAIDTTPDGRPYIALEFAEGGSLDRELKGQPVEPRRAAEMAEVLARAVHFAHEKGVIHRDLKPANVLRGKGGVLKLTDFGLAKQLEVSSGMTPSGAVMGTPSYMAPEQAEGKVKELGPAVDVYGLGAILYEMLTGRPPFRGANLVETLEMVRWAEPPSPTQLVPRLHRDLATVCLKCLRKTPGQRYATAGDLADDLRHWLNGETIVARSAASWEKAWRQVRRRPWQAATVAVTVLAAAALTVGGFYYQTQSLEARAERQQREYEHDRAAQKQADQERLARVQRENEARLNKRSDDALLALDGIRNMIVSGELRNTKELDPLKGKLFAYYKTLNDQLKAEPGYDKTRLATSWVEVGKLIHETGSKDKAWDAYSEARDLYRSGPADAPGARANRAEAEWRLGRLAFELGRYDEAAAACDTVGALLGPAPATAREARLLGEAWHLRGELADRDPRSRDHSAAAYERAIAFHRDALARNLGGDAAPTPAALAALPARLAALERADAEKFRDVVENLRGLALGYGFLGDVLLNARRLTDADAAYWNAHRVREAVVEIMKRVGRQSDQYQRELSKAQSQFSRGWGNCASIQTRSRALGTAKYFSELALESRKKVAAENPNVTEFRRDVCSSANAVADLKITLGEGDGVPELLDLAREVPRDVSEEKGGYSSAARGTIAETQLLRAQYVARFQAANKDQMLAARRELAEGRLALEKLFEGDPGNAALAFKLAAAYALSAELTTSTDTSESRRKRATDTLRTAFELGYSDRHPDDVRLARAFEKLSGDPAFEAVLAKAREALAAPPVKTTASSP